MVSQIDPVIISVNWTPKSPKCVLRAAMALSIVK